VGWAEMAMTMWDELDYIMDLPTCLDMITLNHQSWFETCKDDWNEDSELKLSGSNSTVRMGAGLSLPGL
jgi:hypothetical protein